MPERPLARPRWMGLSARYFASAAVAVAAAA